MTPTMRERAITPLSLADEEDCSSLSDCVRNLTPFTPPGATKFMQSPAFAAGSYTGHPPFFSPLIPSRDVLDAPRVRVIEAHHVSFDHSSLKPRPSDQRVFRPPSSPAAVPLATVMNRVLAPSQTQMRIDSPARTVLAFIPTVNVRAGLGR